ncbi:MAG: right-handed parallel beta-helix repeat-containing protein, partial [Planctomycetota bacterium]
NRCHFTGGTSGIYWVNRPGENGSGQRGVVERCTFENIGVKNNGRDNHGVGVQGSSDIVIKKSLFRNCAGDAIALWVGDDPQRNCHVLDNVIVGTRKPDPGFVGSSGRAITFSAAHDQQQYGNRTGCIVRGNWCDDIEGDCFSSAVWDDIVVEDNDFVQPNDEGEWVIQQFSFGAVPLDPRNNRTWVRDPSRLRSARLAYGFGNPTIPPANVATLHQSNQIGNIVDRPKQPTDVGDKS